MPYVRSLHDFSGENDFSAFFVDIAGTSIRLQHGYAITFENYFRPNDREQFHGNFLILRDFDGKNVGALEFFAQRPLRISTIQGIAGGMPRKFFRETSKNFEETLIDCFLGIVHRHFPAPSPPNRPKVVFSPEIFSRVSSKVRDRILRKYCPKPALRLANSESVHSLKWLRVKERIFSKMRKQQRKRK